MTRALASRMRRMLDAVLARPDDEEIVIRARVGVHVISLKSFNDKDARTVEAPGRRTHNERRSS